MYSEHPLAQLQQLVEQYRHVRNALKQASPNGRNQRTREQQLQEVLEQFEGNLAHWVPEESTREAWRDFLHGRGPLPEAFEPEPPPLFRGSSGDGRLLELVEGNEEEYCAFIDGRLVRRYPSNPAWLESLGDGRFELVEEEWLEVFDSSEDARDALAALVDAGSGTPPWDHALELYEDGLIDSNFSLTHRGRRAMGR